jgi:L-aminopeptidase/D-esterase-like protein
MAVSADEGQRLPEGVLVGHWTDPVGRTGCTVILAPAGAVAGVDVRGAAASTLSSDTLRPGTLVERAHAILLTGGSAFGLDAAGGVMQYLEERQVGYALASVRVPIVAGAVIFDLANGDPRARPDRQAGYSACVAATPEPAVGAVGAGTGATVAKGGAPSQVRPGGFGMAAARADVATVTAAIVTNSVGGVWDDERHDWVVEHTAWSRPAPLFAGTNTTVGALLTDAALTKEQANRVATVAQDGIARAIRPSRTMYDGDTLFCLATGAAEASYDAVESAAAKVVARAIADGVRAAQLPTAGPGAPPGANTRAAP